MMLYINIWLWLACASATTVVYGVTLVIYRLCFHPLAKFPGPKRAAATKWWEFYYDNLKGQGGTYAFQIEKMHDKYGKLNVFLTTHLWGSKAKIQKRHQ